ncbi:MAG: class I SAM-dependent methyltransferase [Deltaproteobacteria bacterium]|nr:class I SAM-dependent methyltransferase [Deltaproteobacteria bacterium]MBZ0219239.1 class I SAM-dependent methyltransferase [Deltaproteobacteria bacterium]
MRLDSCRICGGAEAAATAMVSGYRYVRCASCGVERMAVYPSAEECSRFYESGYMVKEFNNLGHHLHFAPEYRETYFAEKDLTFADLKLDRAALRGRRLLDVGCANGQFIEYANRLGMDGSGIDISVEMVEAARKSGLRCVVKDLFDMEGEYDMLTFWDVIEHVPDPRRMLEKTCSLLTVNGEVVIQTPCTGMISELFGDRWLYYLPVQHLHLFSQESLFRLLSETGFAVVSWVRFGSCNPKGSIPDLNKRAIDTIAKRLGIGDTIALRARKVDN